MSSTSVAESEIEVGRLQTSEVDELVELLREMKVPIAGCTSAEVYRRICRDGLANRNVVALVARSGGHVMGYVLALIDSARYWKSLPRRHPVVALRIFRTRLKSSQPHVTATQHKLPEEFQPYVSSAAHSDSWAESGPQIAKILFIGTHPRFQGRGLGKHLYEACFAELERRGCVRVDARVHNTNIASLRLHVNTGWTMYEAGESVFATHLL